jgi:general stress protein 26
MNQEIIDYISSNNIGVIAVEMLDGSPHGATVHFAHANDPLSFIIMTERSYRKSEAILKNGTTRASFVIGVNENEMRTMQMDGNIKLTDDQTLLDTYFKKFPKKQSSYEPPDDIFLIFTPKWWRFTDFTKPGGKSIISSTD